MAPNGPIDHRRHFLNLLGGETSQQSLDPHALSLGSRRRIEISAFRGADPGAAERAASMGGVSLMASCLSHLGPE